MAIRLYLSAILFCVLPCSILIGCGSQGSSPNQDPPSQTFTIGGTVSGLSGGQLILQNNARDNLALSSNGAFTFSTPLSGGAAFLVTVLTQPSNPAQSCAVANGSGSVTSSNVTSIQVACTSASTSQTPFATAPGEWTWVGGSSTLDSALIGQPGIYGTLGVDAAGNIPGGRYSASSWVEPNGNFWLFGGVGSDSSHDYGRLNDLWEMNLSTNQWAWMRGGETVYQPAVYGTLGVAATGNTPGSRQDATGWTDLNGHFWLFGGLNVDDVAYQEAFNDLWKFDPSLNEWAWMGGSGTSSCSTFCGVPGIFGTLGTPAAGNIPGSRGGAVSWTDASGNLWLFGGVGYDANGVEGTLNDLWRFNPSTNQWAWMGGASSLTDLRGAYWAPAGTYGTLGAPAAGNIPGARSGAAGWTDGNGHLWLFGGSGLDANGNFGDLNDLWQFDPSTNQWAWMGGSSTMIHENGAGEYSQPGVYGTLGVAATGNIPGGRDSALSWTDKRGNFWLFGGFGADANGNGGPRNDLWKFDPALNEWAWMGGSSEIPCVVLYQGTYDPLEEVKCGINGVYGALGTPAEGNLPGSRSSSVTWTDSYGNLWLFGGGGLASTGSAGDLNDLWVYQPQ